MSRGKHYTTDLEVTVEVDADVLEENGWHHEEDCELLAGNGDRRELIDAIESLHRQAHPSQSREPAACREEPCRSMSMDRLLSPLNVNSLR